MIGALFDIVNPVSKAARDAAQSRRRQPSVHPRAPQRLPGVYRAKNQLRPRDAIKAFTISALMWFYAAPKGAGRKHESGKADPRQTGSSRG
jgi:hypothetical protein